MSLTRETAIAQLRAFQGNRLLVSSADGDFTGFIDAEAIGSSTVSVLLIEHPRGDVSQAVVLDLDRISGIREA